jgi:hypothetical protein
VLLDAAGRQLMRRAEDREGDGEIEARALLAQRRGSKVDGYPPVGRPAELGRADPAPDAVLRLLAGAVGEADDREAWLPELDVRLDLDPARVEADERVSDGAGEHGSMEPALASRVCGASVTKLELRIRTA